MKNYKAIIIYSLKVVLFWAIFAFAIFIASSVDPEINWPIKFAGFIGVIYFFGKVLFPEKFD